MPPIYRAVISASMHSQLIQNVMYFAQLDSSKTAQYLAERLAQEWLEVMSTVHSNTMFYTGVDVLRWTGNTEEQGIAGFPPNSKGDNGGVSLTTQDAVLWSLRTGSTNRRKRGRLYIGGIPVVFNDQSLISAAAQPYYRACIDYWQSAYGLSSPPSGFVWGVWSRLNGGVDKPRSEDGFTPITNVLLNPRFTHMNSRRVGVGT